MLVNFDGMRKNATREMNNLFYSLNELLNEYKEDMYESDIQEVKNRYNEAAQAVDIMNCLYDDGVEDDMNDLSYLSVNRFEEEGEEE